MFKELSIKQIIQIFWEGESPTMKEVIKEPVMKQIPTCLSFSFLIDCSIIFFSLFLSKRLQILKKLTRFHWQAFIAYKNGANLKMLLEIFCQKPIVANVILAFLDHLKPWWLT